MTATTPMTLRSGRWPLRTTRSTGAGFSVRNFGVRTVRGQVPIREAWVDVDEHGRPVAVRAVLDLDRLDTGNRRRDADLRKPSLLDLATYPTLTFTAASLVPDADGWRIAGQLDRQGRQVPLDLSARVIATSETGDLTVGVDAEFDRRALGIRAPRLLIGTRVRVHIDAVFAPSR